MEDRIELGIDQRMSLGNSPDFLLSTVLLVQGCPSSLPSPTSEYPSQTNDGQIFQSRISRRAAGDGDLSSTKSLEPK